MPAPFTAEFCLKMGCIEKEKDTVAEATLKRERWGTYTCAILQTSQRRKLTSAVVRRGASQTVTRTPTLPSTFAAILFEWLKAKPDKSGSAIRELFTELDKDGSGAVDVKEFLGGLKAKGIPGLTNGRLMSLHADTPSGGVGGSRQQMTLDSRRPARPETRAV